MKVLPLPLLEIVPGAPPYLVGLMNLAGESIPVIDLSIRLGMSRDEPYTLEMPILLCSDGTQKTGFIVDAILGLVEMDASALQMSSEFAKENSSFDASVPINGELFLLLNVSHVISINLTAQKKMLTVSNHGHAKATKHHE